jgi:predicted mannosyl-3-phosphoglycerate phosphatase (HAD superfamily)
MYKTPIQLVSVALITIGVYMSGAISNEEAWLARVRELEVRVAESEAKSAQENTKIVEKIVFKDKIIKEKGDAIIKYVDNEIVKYDNQCKIPQEFIKALNDAAGVSK